MPDNFVAIDVETANADLASICQIGIVGFEAGEITSAWQSLVDPEDEFDFINISIHGIDETAVADSPRFVDLVSDLEGLLSDRIVVSHMPFDRLAMTRAAEKYRVTPPECTWLDSARVARRAWSQFAQRGYGLGSLAEWCGIEFRHHDAVEDARAAGQILVRAMTDSGLDLDEWVVRSQQPIGGKPASQTRTGDPDGPLAGEVVVFTGALSMPRREAADLAASRGCDVMQTVGNRTTLLVVGQQDLRRLSGHKRSSKHRKAEAMIGQGHPIRIIGEPDFKTLVEG